MIQIIDDFIPVKDQLEIKKLVLNDGFPWYFKEDVTSVRTEKEKRMPAFSHFFKNNGNVNSNVYFIIEPLGIQAAQTVNYNITDIINVKTFLQLPLAKATINKVDDLHIDIEGPHLVLLYYVCDSDGDTIIVDKKFNGVYERKQQYSDYDILHRVTPKQGRAVIFDGAYYHTAEQPKDNIRCVINFNIV